MKIRKARLADVPEILKMWKELMGSHQKLSTRRFFTLKKDAAGIFEKYLRRSIRSRNSLVLVAEEGDLVAYSINHIKKNIPVYLPEKYGYFSDLFVKEKHRGKGITSQFRKLILAWFREKGLKQARIAVDAENKHARAVYEHWGMKYGHLELIQEI